MKKVKLGLQKKTKSGLAVYSKKVKLALITNADVFPALPVSPETFGNNIAEYETSLQDALLGGKAATSLCRTKRIVVENNLRDLASYVETVAQGSEDIIYLAGMEPQQRGPHHYDSLETPQNLRGKSRLSGTAKLLWKPVAHAKAYEVEYCADPITANGWTRAAHSAAGNTIVTGLTRKEDYWFRVRALGSRGIVSNWSDACMIVVV